VVHTIQGNWFPAYGRTRQYLRNVATTDKRSEVKDFGKEQGVLVLDGHFMSLLSRSDSILEYRFSEEELFSEIEKYTLGKLDDDWKGRVVKSKALLAKGLSFDSCNMWLEQGKYFAEQVITNPSHRQLAYRLCFLYRLVYGFTRDASGGAPGGSGPRSEVETSRSACRLGDRGLGVSGTSHDPKK